MVAGGVKSILIANQIVGEKKIERLCELSKKAEIIVAVDNEEVAIQMNKLAEENNVHIKILVEINIGMDRAGVETGETTLSFCKHIADLKNLNFLGVMAWEGHTVAIEDQKEKAKSISDSMEKLMKTVKLLTVIHVEQNFFMGNIYLFL